MALFTNRVIAITGAASGIGLSTAHLLASRGAILSLADLNATALSSTEKALQTAYPATQIHTYELDVRSETSVQSWISAIITTFGRLDGAANLAGVIGPSIGLKGIAEQDLSEWGFILSVNLTGVMLCMKHQLQHITSPGGSIVNASSIAGLIGQPNNAAYAASKHAVLGLTKTAAKEVGKKGVRVNAVCPGYIDTPMNVKSRETMENAVMGDEEALQRVKARRKGAIEGVALGRGGTSEEVAELICFLLGEGSAFVTGQGVSVDGGWYC